MTHGHHYRPYKYLEGCPCARCRLKRVRWKAADWLAMAWEKTGFALTVALLLFLSLFDRLWVRRLLLKIDASPPPLALATYFYATAQFRNLSDGLFMSSTGKDELREMLELIADALRSSRSASDRRQIEGFLGFLSMHCDFDMSQHERVQALHSWVSVSTGWRVRHVAANIMMLWRRYRHIHSETTD